MSAAELDAIRQRHAADEARVQHGGSPRAFDAHSDREDLLVEIDRLRGRLGAAEDDLASTEGW